MTARRKFADGTDVPVTKTRAELEELLTRNGAVATAVCNSPEAAAVAFEMHGRRVLIRLPMPPPKDRQFTHVIAGARGEQERSAAAAQQAHDKACRQKWRAAAGGKAKLVSVAEDVETFENAFLAHIVLPDGGTGHRSSIAHWKGGLLEGDAQIEQSFDPPVDRYALFLPRGGRRQESPQPSRWKTGFVGGSLEP